MDIIWWSLIILCFFASFIGLLYPIIPSVVMIWAGVLLYHFLVFSDALTWWTWGTLLMLTIVLFVVDYIANLYFVKRYGASKWGMRAATIGLIIGSFILPPFGILLVPFALVLITELIQRNSIPDSLKVAFGTFIAFLSSTFAKAVIQLTIILVFVIDIIF
ncbi:DUF456 domain-containing protein [Bacillus solitudinis]|uniref:DUF456 domain-containing protein n=1 Tax=Bacillus solitudinis TaxID=2014074 RepID=UPI000C24C7CB|nr:DUF456 domain-containing protein [Bacillus solitudinis]